MGIADLASSWAKLGRAYEHLDAFNREFQTFTLQNTKPVGITFRRENAWYVVDIDPLPAVPPRLAGIVGDYLNNLRAALDQLIWQLVLREDQKPRHTHRFPIYTDRQKFTDEVKSPTKKREKRSPLHGIPTDGDTWAIIEEAQPFNRPQPQDDDLLLLTQFTNMDKHRTSLVRQAFLDEKSATESIRWRADLQPIERKFRLAPLSEKHPTEVIRLRFAPNVDPGMDVKGDIRINPSIGDGKTQVSYNQLPFVYQHVREILEKFAALPRVQR